MIILAVKKMTAQHELTNEKRKNFSLVSIYYQEKESCRFSKEAPQSGMVKELLLEIYLFSSRKWRTFSLAVLPPAGVNPCASPGRTINSAC